MARARRGLRSVAATAARPAVRCVAYCRVSTDDRLDQQFNSLDAQQEACEAYINLHREDGWTTARDCYSDGGYSAANTKRPALQQLLADIEAGKIDCVVVYKYDRLSRSMLDFLQLLDFFKQHRVSFASVSQRFDTSTPVGEVTLNILLSFAQFERQIIAERTRDKMRASRRRGKWTGGVPPLGYDVAPEGGRLVVNKAEAVQVRGIFDSYADLGSIMKVVEDLNRRGWRRKSWTTREGKHRQGGGWCKRTVRQLLIDPLYIGRQKLGDETFPGDHKGIVRKARFDEVQELLAGNRRDGGARARNRHGVLLRSLIRCAVCDAPMTHAASKNRRGRSYRYYRCSASMKRGASTCPTRSVSAPKVENFVVEQIRRIGKNPELQRETSEQAVSHAKAHLRGLKAESRRLERDLRPAKKRVRSIVATLTDCNGASRSAVQQELEKAQEHVQTLEIRIAEIRTEKADLELQTLDEADLAAALEAFDPIWQVLLTPEKERVLRQLIERIDYDGESEELTIAWRLSGFGELASEIGEDKQ